MPTLPTRKTTPVHGLSSRELAPLLPPEDEPASLRRTLGLFSATVLVVGGIIGSGIFFTPSVVARELPSAGLIMLVWAIGGAVALAGALTYAELGAMLPRAGGPYVYIREAFGEMPAFLYGWMVLASIATGALAAVALSFGQYLGRFVNLAFVGGPIGVAVVTIAVLTYLNYLGVKPGALVQNVLTVSKSLALAALILGGLILWTRVSPIAVQNAPAPRGSIVVGLMAAFVPVLFTIGGWQQMNMVAGEIREPARTIPRALVIGIAIVVAIYLGANLVYLHALGRDALAQSGAVAADASMHLAGPNGARLLTVGVLLSILGFVNVIILANSRIVYAMARDGSFFRSAGHVHHTHGSPHVAILIIGVWGIALLLLTRGSLPNLLSGVVFADWIFFALGAASVFVLRRKKGDIDRPYRAKGYPWLPALFILAAIAGILSAIVSAPGMSLLGATLLVIGFVVHRVARARGVWVAPAPDPDADY